MAGKRGDNHQVERVAAFGWIDVEFTGGPEPEVYVATIEKVGMPFSRVQLDSLHIADLIGALRRAKKKLLRADA